MSDVERTHRWQLVREALLDFAWRDRYTRWYLILVYAWWLGQWFALVQLVDVDRHPWLASVGVFTGYIGQSIIGKVIETLKRWNKAQADYDERKREDA